MRTVTKYLLAVACAVAFIASADAQGRGGRGGAGGGGGGGQPPGGGRGQGGGMMGGGFAPGLAQLVTNKGVIEELKITDDQKEKLATWAKDAQAKMQEKMRELFTPGEAPDMAKMAEMRTTMAKEQMEEVSKVLKEEQVKRLKQITLQTQGLAAFSNKDVQTSLKLTDEQKDAIKEIGDASRKEMMELFPRPMQGGERPSAETMAENAKKRAELTKKYFEKAKNQLKDDQKKTWEEMTGKAFEYKAEPVQRRRDN